MVVSLNMAFLLLQGVFVLHDNAFPLFTHMARGAQYVNQTHIVSLSLFCCGPAAGHWLIAATACHDSCWLFPVVSLQVDFRRLVSKPR